MSLLCAYCAEREADRVDEHMRPECLHCAELPEPSPLEIASMIVDRAILAGKAVNN